MPIVSKTVLKSYFEDGKEPDENKYIDLIDTMVTGDLGLYALLDGSSWFTGSIVISTADATTDVVIRNTNASELARLRFDGSVGVKGIIQLAGTDMGIWNWVGPNIFFGAHDTVTQRQLMLINVTTTYDRFDLGQGTQDTYVRINSGNAKYSWVELQTGASPRWRIAKDANSETGGNAGSDFSIYRYSDAGGYLGRPMWIARSTGLITFEHDVKANTDVNVVGGLGIGSIGFVTTSGRLKVTERAYVGVGLYVGNTSPASNPGTGDIVASNNITASSIFYGQDIYLYESTTQMTDITAQDTTWSRINQNTAHNIYTPRYFAAAAGLQAGGSTNPGTGYVGYTAGLRPNKNSTQYYAYSYVPLGTPLTSTAWDGDAKGNTAGTVIDLSAVFGAPAGLQAVNVRVIGKANNAGPTDSNYFYVGQSASDDAHVGCYLWGNVYMDNMGPANCDSNGDIWYTVQSGATAYCIIRIMGYWI